MTVEIKMYATTVCPYCSMALSLLKRKGIDVSKINKILIDKEVGKKEEMMELTNRRTVPQIFINDVYVGGYDDLQALETAGKLSQMLI